MEEAGVGLGPCADVAGGVAAAALLPPEDEEEEALTCSCGTGAKEGTPPELRSSPASLRGVALLSALWPSSRMAVSCKAL